MQRSESWRHKRKKPLLQIAVYEDGFRMLSTVLETNLLATQAELSVTVNCAE